MLIIMERFGQTYTFEAAEGMVDEPKKDTSEAPQEFIDLEKQSTLVPSPEMNILDAVEAIGHLLGCVFPEMEGHHLELVCEHKGSCGEEDEGEDDRKGIDLDKN